MGWTEKMMVSFKFIRIRQALHQALSLGIIVTSALMIWKGLMCITVTESPVVVVLTGKAWNQALEGLALVIYCFSVVDVGLHDQTTQILYLGDILFLQMSKDPIRVGEIVVYNIIGRDIPIVHRVIKVHEQREKEEVDILTKGDNNLRDDISLYNGELWLQRHHIMGRAVGFLPYVGYVTIILTDKPIIKYVLIGVIGFLVIVSKD